MGASKEFFTQLREDEQYATLSVDMETYGHIKLFFQEEDHYKLHSIKQINKSHKEDELLCEMYKKRSKLKKEITEREQFLNHNNK